MYHTDRCLHCYTHSANFETYQAYYRDNYYK